MNGQTASLALFGHLLCGLVFDIHGSLPRVVSNIRHWVRRILINRLRGLQCGRLDLGGVSVIQRGSNIGNSWSRAMSTNVDCDHCNQCCVLSLSLVACFELVHNAVSRYALERHQLHTFFPCSLVSRALVTIMSSSATEILLVMSIKLKRY